MNNNKKYSFDNDTLTYINPMGTISELPVAPNSGMHKAINVVNQKNINFTKLRREKNILKDRLEDTGKKNENYQQLFQTWSAVSLIFIIVFLIMIRNISKNN
tara:strand:- start:737 stop:1042 length:306 start_codon:yes stop_codon:yes gene_type:complete